MLTSSNFESLLKKHGYHMAGSHSAVKTCLWLNKSLRGEGKCYKFQFYGIASHRCVQMTPTMQCNQKCLHCWRPTEIDVPETGWDSPELIVEESLKAQQRLISGYGGADIIDKTLWEEAKNPRHVAISLAGEPTIYPYLDRLIDVFHSKNMTTFVVTNGTYPAMVEQINPTQLYLSLNAPDEYTYRQTCNPQEEEMWERICKSLDILREKQTRTVLRITLTEGLNISSPEGYAALIDRASPDYIEIKAYMHLGFSQKRLERSAMPTHQRIREFSERIMQYTDYKQADESQISRIVLLSKNGDVKKIV